MKKTSEKLLRLSAETLRTLDAAPLGEVGGGYIIVSVAKATAWPYTCPVTLCGCLPGG